MKALFLTLGLFTLLSPVVFTEKALANSPQSVATRPDSSCQVDAQDPNDTGYRLTDNSLKYSGQCINGEKLRPLQKLNLNSNTAVFNNYMHDNQFWQAEVDLKQVKAVYFQIMRFAAIEGITAAHTQLRFVFDDANAVKLSKGSQRSSSSDLLISFEAAFPKDVSYNFALGAFSNYAIFARIMSTDQKQNDSAEEIEQYELSLDQVEKIELLKNALEYAEELGIGSFYNTLRPNCTTEVFDLIDSLPRFKDNQAPFLTVISSDPIAGPSLRALERRKILKRRIQDFSQERNGLITELPIPVSQNSLSPFLVDVKDSPWTLTLLQADTSHLSETEKAALTDLHKQLMAELPLLLQSYGSMAMLDPSENQGLFLQSLKELVSRAPSVLQRLNSRLPKEAIRVGLYFSPFKSESQSTDLRALGLPAELPFAIRKYQVGQMTPQGAFKSSEFYSQLNAGLVEASKSTANLAASKAFLMGISIVIQAQKDQSKVFTQVMVDLNEMEQDLKSESPQVRIEKVIVPEGDAAHSPALIITHLQDAQVATINEFVDVQFGTFGGIAGPMTEYGLGTFQIFKNHYRCDVQTRYSPYFFGRINDQFTGIQFVDFFLKNASIQFHLTRMSLNLKTKQVADMQLAIKALGFQCLGSEDANRQFTENANQALTDFINDKQNQGLLGIISPLIK